MQALLEKPDTVPAIRSRTRFVEIVEGTKPETEKTDNGGGRPSKFNADTEKIILDYIGKGTPLKHAAAVAGISYATLNRWINEGISEGKAGNVAHPLCKFCTAIKKAEAEAIASSVSKVRADDSWQASAWFLERRDSEHFARKDKLAISGRLDSASVTISVDAMREEIPDGSLVSILEKVAGRMAGRLPILEGETCENRAGEALEGERGHNPPGEASEAQ